MLLTAWAAVSLAWTGDRTLGVQDVLRDLVYVAAAMVAILLGGRASTSRLLDAVLVAGSAVTVYSLATDSSPIGSASTRTRRDQGGYSTRSATGTDRV